MFTQRSMGIVQNSFDIHLSSHQEQGGHTAMSDVHMGPLSMTATCQQAE